MIKDIISEVKKLIDQKDLPENVKLALRVIRNELIEHARADSTKEPALNKSWVEPQYWDKDNDTYKSDPELVELYKILGD